jgi:hypothetical protein
MTSAARGAGEEDDAFGVACDLGEVAHHPSLAPAASGLGDGHGCPHAFVELTSELGDEAILVFAHIDVALVEDNFTMTRLHAQELDLYRSSNSLPRKPRRREL